MTDYGLRTPTGRHKQVELPRAYAYLCEDLLVCRSEVNRTKERLARFAASSNLELAAVFVGQDTRSTAGFGRLFEAVVRDEVKVVLVPSVLHLMVLGSPRRIREYFEAATEARVMTMP